MHNDHKVMKKTSMFAQAILEIDRLGGPEEVMKWILENVDMVINNPEYKSQVSCKMGCSLCCHDKIVMSEYEAKYIRNKIKGKINPDKALLKIHVESNDFMKLPWEHKKCSLLDENNMCSIYEDRPLICRTHNSMEDPIKCIISSDGKSPNHKQVYTVDTEAIQYALFLIGDNKQVNLHDLINGLD